jgi:hypothetical protein
MNCRQCSQHIFLCAAYALVLLSGAATTSFAQDGAKTNSEKWRPKDGTYADPSAAFSLRCGEDGDVIVELKEKSISGNEWSCNVTRLTDTSPGTIRLDMTCYDYNLALNINGHDPNAYERKFKEIMLLRKIDGKAMFVRKTTNGKFKDPDWRAAYCPEEAQRMYAEATAKSKAEAEQKTAAERLSQNPWRPQNGVYATPGANFDDRCQKDGDATIDFAERSISRGTDKCSVTFIRDEPNAVQLFATCSPEPNASGSTAAPRSSETIILRKIDGKSVLLQKSKNGDFVDTGAQLSYCGQEAQRKYVQQKANK